MRVLVDTNGLARAAAGPPGPAYEVVQRATEHEHVLILSPFLADELGRVLRYPRMRPLHSLSDEEIDQFIMDLMLVADVVEPGGASLGVSSDRDDDPILAAAYAGQAEVICTRDRHFHEPAVKEFCAAHKIEILSDLELLAGLRGGAKP